MRNEISFSFFEVTMSSVVHDKNMKEYYFSIRRRVPGSYRDSLLNIKTSMFNARGLGRFDFD